jgi:dolichol-phosphate mannosyltransferase
MSGHSEVEGTRPVRRSEASALAQGRLGMLDLADPVEVRPFSREAPPSAPLVDHPGARYLVVMPTFNELENVPRILPLVLAQDPRIDVLVVDDNSPDGTGELAERMAAAEPRLHVLRRPGKDGLGRAYVAGFTWGIARGYDLVIEMDADLSHHPDNLPALIGMAHRYDAVIGSRYVGGRVTVVNWPMGRLLISYFGSWYARWVTRVPVRDLTGGYNCWRRSVLEAIDVSRVTSNGYMFQIELKLRAWRRGFRLVEIPIVFAERREGTSKMSKKIVREAVWKVWKLRLMALAGRL